MVVGRVVIDVVGLPISEVLHVVDLENKYFVEKRSVNKT